MKKLIVAAALCAAVLPRMAMATFDTTKYTQLKYIGTKVAGEELYVDTLFHPSEKTRFEMRFQIPEGVTLTGSANMGMIESLGNNVYSRFHFTISPIGSYYLSLRNKQGEYIISQQQGGANAWTDVTIDALNSKVAMNGKEQTVTCNTGLLDPANNATFWLFARNSKTMGQGGGAWMRIASARIYEENSLMLDLCPCREKTGEQRLGMYDQVNNEFLPCKGGDDSMWEEGPEYFLIEIAPLEPVWYAGAKTRRPPVKVFNFDQRLTQGVDYELVYPDVVSRGRNSVTVRGLGKFAEFEQQVDYQAIPKLPEGYTTVEYVKSTAGGTQYIDLQCQLTGTSDVRMIIDVDTSQADYCTTFGARDLNGKAYKMTKASSSTWGLSCTPDCEVADLPSALGVQVNEIFPTKGFYNINNVSNEMTAVADCVIAADAYLFCFHDLKNTNPRYTRMSVYSFMVWQDGVLVRDLVPCRTSGGVYGFYDLAANAQKRFYASESATPFAGGADLPIPTPPPGFAILLK